MFLPLKVHAIVASFFLSSLLIRRSHAADTNQFTIPGPPGGKYNFESNPTFPINRDTVIRWKTDWDKISLALWQFNNSTKFMLLDKVDAQYRYTWDADVEDTFDLTVSNVFSFSVYNAVGDSSENFSSHYFNITGGPTPSSGTSTSSSTADPTATTSSGSSASTSKSDSSGLSTGAKAGIGVGAGVGGAAIIGILAFFLARRRRSQPASLKGADASLLSPYEHSPYPPHQAPMQYAAYKPPIPGQSPHSAAWKQEQSPQELPPEDVRIELGAIPGREERQELPGDMEGGAKSPDQSRWKK